MQVAPERYPSVRLHARVVAPAPIGFAIPLFVLIAASWTVGAQTPKTVLDGVYTETQATRGERIVAAQCAVCHGKGLEGALGPPLAGADFLGYWDRKPLSDLVDKIEKTMPAGNPGTLTRQQATDIAAHVLRANRLPTGRGELTADDTLRQVALVRPGGPAPAAAGAATDTNVLGAAFALSGNLGQVMKGILFPSSNLIFNVQAQDPGVHKVGAAYQPPAAGGFSWVDWGAGIYSGWELVDNAAIALAESAPLLLTPGRRCENGKPVPVGRSDWIKFTQELVDAGRAAYKASQTRNQEAVSTVTELVADACLHCHEVYRDKPGGTTLDPSNKAARCVP